ncbi:hypothetical protein MCOR27_009765 [Pyricularia oryzae]|uniref:Uncharacterized protein n=1 Tax=Pyricularia grisea TaxID=148305 RepID=A0ABQ8NYQ0_PYRGI|nr:hypothetical protein MCOR01_010199 [Pyricularia oryzae]KAI6304061.1 hypothetical protein MCOR33_000807 [Pyricularia grisea]KAI6255376.1 hypothetical protein MCOR19_008131 [Pyricularia oryzae]KAI6269337.1 hypothetical protein MCOR26_008769 [Pyricularia oryzae]KAI6269354.1 hypothetical protein MCOR27_009765 [Pyricularia oryzae]
MRFTADIIPVALVLFQAFGVSAYKCRIYLKDGFDESDDFQDGAPGDTVHLTASNCDIIKVFIRDACYYDILNVDDMPASYTIKTKKIDD